MRMTGGKGVLEGYGMTRTRWRCVFFLVLGVLIFGASFNILDNAPTNWDDPALFTRTCIQDINLENLRDVLSVSRSSTYQPVRDLSYMMDFALFRDRVVLGMHLHGIFLTWLMVIACWFFLVELFRHFDVAERQGYLWASFSSVIYAVHPVHVESVAWLYARKEPLLGIFVFISLWAFLRARRKDWRFYCLSGIGLVLAIFSKPTALAVPGIMIVLDLAEHAQKKTPGFWKKRLMLYIPVLVIVVPMMIRLVLMMESAGGIKPWHGGSIWTNFFAVSQIFVEYMGLTGFTINYAADYPLKLFTDLHQWQAWFFVGINLVFIASAVIAWKRRWYLYAVFVAWFYIFLVPVSHLLPIAQVMADRYDLLSSLSWCVLLGYGLTRLWMLRLPDKAMFSETFPLLISAALFLVLVVSYTGMTIRQNDVWQDSRHLWEDTLAKYPESSPANVNLSVIYIHEGRFEEAQDLCIRAIKHLPYDYLAISNLALCQLMRKQYDNAIHNYQQALTLKPDLYKASLGLAAAFWGKGAFNEFYIFGTGMEEKYQINSASFYSRMGYASWKTGHQKEAGQYLSKASMLCKGEREITELGLIRTSMGK